MKLKFENLRFENLKFPSSLADRFVFIESFRCSLLTFGFSLMAIAFCLSAFSQPKEISSSELLHRIEGLKTVASVLYIAAHPDDENTRLITYLEKDKHYRVAYLSLTRGEGGQNLIGNEQGIDLGILRTQELLAARAIDGGEQFFSTAYDFGYSKTAEETMRKWGKEKITNDILTVMNHFQPDIVICRFPTTGEGGHGHHTASAMLAEYAFDSLVKAKGIYVPKKLFWNTFNFGNNNTTREDQLKIDVGGYNALLGKSYGEIAAEARSMHRCQAFGSERRRGEQFEYFKILRGDTSKVDLMDGIVTDWSRFKGGDAINKKIDAIVKAFDVKDPSKSVKALSELKDMLFPQPGKKNNLWNLWPEADEIIKVKQSEIDDLIADCLGIYIEFISDKTIFEVKDSLSFKINAINRSGSQIKILTAYNPVIRSTVFGMNKPTILLEKNKLFSKNFKVKLESNLKYYSFPYPVYNEFMGIDDNGWYAEFASIVKFLPEFRHPNNIPIMLIDNDKMNITIGANLNFKFVDPSYGEIYQPLFFTLNDSLSKNYILKQIKYDHIPTQIYYTKPDPILTFEYAKTVQKKIAYISGAGDKIPDILSQLGYDVTLLNESNISTFELANFSTIVTGVRAFNTEKWLTEYKDELLKYVEEGGNLLIQYNTSNGLVAEIPKPFPFKISRDRITEEESEAIILDTNAKIMNYPNKIGKDDFKNWIQEYGLYFPSEVDTNYNKILSLHDTGENPNENSTIYCNYGKGKYVYTGLSFFRELPAGVPGAVKLFINLMEDNIVYPIRTEDILPLKNGGNVYDIQDGKYFPQDKKRKKKSKK